MPGSEVRAGSTAEAMIQRGGFHVPMFLPVTDAGPEVSSSPKGLVTWTICFSGGGRMDSVSSELRRMTGTSKPHLQEQTVSPDAFLLI